MSLLLLGEAFAIPAFSARGDAKQIEESFQGLAGDLLGLEDLTKLSPDQIADRLERIFRDIDKAKKNIPRDTFDLYAILRKIGMDPIKLFEWVRDNTFLIPYRGVLRGHQGVLMDRLGNSFDRALLLYALLRESKNDARLARGSLSKNQAREILKKAHPLPRGESRSGKESVSEGMDTLLDDYAQRYQLNKEKIREKYKNIQLKQKQFSEKVGKRVRKQARELIDRLGHSDKDMKNAIQEAAVNAIQDHWWVQWHDGVKWMHLDPTFQDAEPGQSLIEPKETIKPNNYAELEDFCHSIRIRLEVEYWEKGKLEKAEVLNQIMLPLVMFGKRIVLRHIPPVWPKDWKFYQEEYSTEELKKLVLNQREWLPVLSVDASNIYKYSFLTDSKNIFDATLPAWAAAALKGREVVDATKEGTETTGNRLKNLLARRSKVRKPQESEKPTGIHLTAEWIEYEIHVPGEKKRKIRREIFDLLGPAIRASGSENVSIPAITEEKRLERGFALLDQIEILPLVCQLSPEFVADLAAEKMLTNQEILLDIIRGGGFSNNQELADKLNMFAPFPWSGYSLALARKEWSRLSGDVYLDRPNILSYFKGVRQCPECNLLEFQGYDIIANEVAVHPSSNTDPFQARLEQGVLDTNAEAFLLSSLGKTFKNTAELFDISQNRNSDWLIIRDAFDSSWKEITHSEDIKERIKQELSEGFIVVVPKNMVSVEEQDIVGWWRINPNTGHTLGIGEYGKGQTDVEHLLFTAASVIESLTCFMTMISQPTDPGMPIIKKYISITLCIIQGWIFLGGGVYATKAVHLGIIALAGTIVNLLVGGLALSESEFWKEGRR